MAQDIRSNVLELMKQKDKIEDEIKQLSSILAGNGVGMDDPLVDSQGFPLSNIDIYQVRHARHRLICLQNDHKNLMKQIENGLEGYYSTTNQQNHLNDVEMREVNGHNGVVNHETPFAKVTEVTQDSPADLADLRVHDQIVEFGSVNASNFKKITDIANVVQHSENQPISVKLLRGHRFVNVKLIPKRWPGRGLLGCNIESL